VDFNLRLTPISAQEKAWRTSALEDGGVGIDQSQSREKLLFLRHSVCSSLLKKLDVLFSSGLALDASRSWISRQRPRVPGILIFERRSDVLSSRPTAEPYFR
jgi:hypothetical protein